MASHAHSSLRPLIMVEQILPHRIPYPQMLHVHPCYFMLVVTAHRWGFCLEQLPPQRFAFGGTAKHCVPLSCDGCFTSLRITLICLSSRIMYDMLQSPYAVKMISHSRGRNSDDDFVFLSKSWASSSDNWPAKQPFFKVIREGKTNLLVVGFSQSLFLHVPHSLPGEQTANKLQQRGQPLLFRAAKRKIELFNSVSVLSVKWQPLDWPISTPSLLTFSPIPHQWTRIVECRF